MNKRRKVNWYLLGLVLFLTISTLGISIYSWFSLMGINQQSHQQLEDIATQYQRDIDNSLLMMDAELDMLVGKHTTQLQKLNPYNPKDLVILTDLIDYQFRKITQYRYYFGAGTSDGSLIGYLYNKPIYTSSKLSTYLDMSNDKEIITGMSSIDTVMYLHRAKKGLKVGDVMPIISLDLKQQLLMQFATLPPLNQNPTEAAPFTDYEVLILNGTGTEGLQFSYEDSLNTRFGEATDDALLIGKNIIDHTLADDSILYAIAPLKDDAGHVVVYTLNKASSNKL